MVAIAMRQVATWYRELIANHNSEVSLLTSWVDTLYVKHRIFASRSLFNNLLQVVGRLNVLVVHLLDDKASGYSCIF